MAKPSIWVLGSPSSCLALQPFVLDLPDYLRPCYPVSCPCFLSHIDVPSGDRGRPAHRVRRVLEFVGGLIENLGGALCCSLDFGLRHSHNVAQGVEVWRVHPK